VALCLASVTHCHSEMLHKSAVARRSGSFGVDDALELMRYAVYHPNDPRKGTVLPDRELGQIVLGEGDTITKALAAANPSSGAMVWDRREKRVAYTVP
jgi:hypothetical protein